MIYKFNLILKAFANDMIKAQMAIRTIKPSEKELDDIAARILSNKDEVKRLSEVNESETS